MASSEDLLGNLSSLLNDASLLTLQVHAFSEVNHSKLHTLTQLSNFHIQGKVPKVNKDLVNQSNPDHFYYIASEKEHKASLLRDERNDYMTELEDLKAALHILSIDCTHLDSVIEKRMELEKEKRELEDIISQKDLVIDGLQEQNTKLQEENKQFVAELVAALEEDGVYITPSNSG